MGTHTLTTTTHSKLGKKENTGLISFSPRPLLERGLGTRLGLIAALSNRPTSCEIFTVCMVRKWAIPFNKGTYPLELFDYPGTSTVGYRELQ